MEVDGKFAIKEASWIWYWIYLLSSLDLIHIDVISMMCYDSLVRYKYIYKRLPILFFFSTHWYSYIRKSLSRSRSEGTFSDKLHIFLFVDTPAGLLPIRNASVSGDRQSLSPWNPYLRVANPSDDIGIRDRTVVITIYLYVHTQSSKTNTTQLIVVDRVLMVNRWPKENV